MPLSYENYDGDNVTTTFPIPFTYTATSEISVTVDAVAQTGLTFPSASEVQLTSAPASGTVVQVRRTTDLTSRAVDFASGSVLTEEDLDNSNIQIFHSSQEAVDLTNDSVTLSSDDKWDMENKVVKNVADPSAAQDAATKNYVDTAATSLVQQAEAARDAAIVAQTAAETAETNAETAETNAETAETGAQSAQTAAESAKTGAETARDAALAAQTAAETAETNAETAETNAETAETNASTSATLAGNYANKIDGAVESSNYSSKAWALGGTGVTDTAGSGSSKEWATDTSNQVDGTEYSAKEYAIGTQRRGAANGGSAKDWATYTGGTVDDSGYSAKYWAQQAEAYKTEFSNVYHGALPTDPTLDPDLSALEAGDLYFNTTTSKLKYYDGSAWNNIEATDTSSFATQGFAVAMAIAL